MDEIESAEELEESQGEEIIIATIDSVSSDGVTLVVDGDDSAGQKKYKVNCGAWLAVGDRVKLTRNSGTYIVDFVIGNPMERFPIPAGGTDGQYLAKDGSNNFAVKWVNAQATHGIPAGGTTGKYLIKLSDNDYDAAWGDVVVTQLKIGTRTVSFTGAAFYPSNTCSLGLSSNRFTDCFLSGSMYFGTRTDKIGFFGSTPITQEAVSNTATVATLITTLKKYGLIR